MLSFHRIIPVLCLSGILLSSCTNFLRAIQPAKPIIATLKSPSQVDSASKEPTTRPTTDSLNGQVFKIGLLLPFTGPLAFLGEGYKMGIDLALKEDLYTIAGVPVDVILGDTGGTVEGTVQAANELIQTEKVNLMIGPGTSPEALAAIPIATGAQVPLIDATSTSPLLLAKMGENGSQWYYRINADEKILARAFTNIIIKDKKSIAIIAEDGQFQKEIAAEYIRLFQAAGLTISLEEYFPVTETEYRPVLFRTRQSRPDALFLVMSETSCAILMRQYKKSFTTIPVYSRGACATGLFNQITLDDSSVGENITEAVIFSDFQDPKLAVKFQNEYSQSLSGHRMAGYYAAKYAVIPALRSLIESGKPVTPENIRKSVDTVDIETPLGQMKFDNFNQAYLDAVLLTNKDGHPAFLSPLSLK
jgi:branched-chain amino acid transport system substrate-binding protein